MDDLRLGRIAGLGLVILALSMPATAAKLYKWVDEQGNVSYSQLPPPKGDAESIELKGLQGVTNSEAEERLDVLRDKAETARKDREFKANYTSESRDREARLKQNCETARQNLRVLETASRVKAEDGTFIDDSARAEQTQRAQKQVNDFCN